MTAAAKQYLIDRLRASNGDVRAVAKEAGINRTYLYEILTTLNIDQKEFQPRKKRLSHFSNFHIKQWLTSGAQQ
jgi:hypothetical protein